jgi:hypothetical protein
MLVKVELASRAELFRKKGVNQTGGKMRFVAPVLFALLACTLAFPQPKTSSEDKKPDRKGPIFNFRTDEFWLNLHHFLYVLGRATNKERDASRDAVKNAPADQEKGLTLLKPEEQAIWREAVAAYAGGLSKKDLVFDRSLAATTGLLARERDAKKLPLKDTDSFTMGVLERSAPVYRKVWWPQHSKANEDWTASMRSLTEKHGPAMLSFITDRYKYDWPADGFDVHVSGYANWAGAYSTDGKLLVVTSLDTNLQGNYGLETIFHEAMHQWDEAVQAALQTEADKLKLPAPDDLSHALIFYTAGEAARRVFPGHAPYAEKAGIWNRRLGRYKTALDEAWKPYLDGRGSREEALAEILKRVAAAQDSSKS